MPLPEAECPELVNQFLINPKLWVNLPTSQTTNNMKKAGSSLANWDLVSEEKEKYWISLQCASNWLIMKSKFPQPFRKLDILTFPILKIPVHFLRIDEQIGHLPHGELEIHLFEFQQPP